ncbi:MAG: cyclic nucleotide-binding domain-containing protein [Deltaproteobacteria bacterium]|nr:cyclic nucleotide-binding domain-containing protein [Deltaproteobacteria bacterium]
MSGEMEFEFIEGKDGFVATDKVLTFLRQHLAKGEVQLAARLYEDSGTAGIAPGLLREATSASSTTQKAMAEMFLIARDFKNAAAVFEMARGLERAAQLYEQGLDFENAARCYEKTGELVRAAVCLERAGKIDAAIDLYKKAGPSQGLAEALARQGHYFDAAAIYKHIFNLKAEIEMLRLVPVTSENRVTAVLRLAELLEQYNYPDQAVGLLIETVRTVDAARFHQTMYSQLARLLDGMGRTAEAAQVRGRMQNQLAPSSGVVVGGPTAGPAPVAVGPSPVSAHPGMTVGPSPLTVGPSLPSGAMAAPVRLAAAPVVEAGPAPRDPFGALVDPFGAGGKPSSAGDAYAHLKNIPIFGELAQNDMRELYRSFDDVSFADGGVIIEQGVPGPGLVVIIQGNVRVLRGDAMGITELARLGSGSYVGELSLIDTAPTSARVVADGSVLALRISRDRFNQFLLNHETAAFRIFQLFARTLAERLRTANLRK